MSLIFATQLTAVATLALASLALATAILAYLAWRKQSREVRDQAEMLRLQSEQLAEDRKVNAEQIRVLGLQAEELGQVSADREREAHERRRAQAELVYMWVILEDEDKMVAHVRNTSQQPVYEVAPQGAPDGGATMWIEPLMPGQEFSYTVPLPLT